jgi:hypothetical protein
MTALVVRFARARAFSMFMVYVLCAMRVLFGQHELEGSPTLQAAPSWAGR